MESVYVLCAGQGKRFVFDYEKEIAKALIPLKPDFRIIDFQMMYFQAYGLNDITLVLGWYGQQILDYCREKPFDLKFVWDKTIVKHGDNIGRTFMEIKDGLLSCRKPLLIVYCDQIWNDLALRQILRCKGDYCRIRATNGLMKFTQKGIKELLSIIEEYDFNDLHLATPYVRDRGNIEFVSFNKGYMRDIDCVIDLRKVQQHFGWR